MMTEWHFLLWLFGINVVNQTKVEVSVAKYNFNEFISKKKLKLHTVYSFSLFSAHLSTDPFKCFLLQIHQMSFIIIIIMGLLIVCLSWLCVSFQLTKSRTMQNYSYEHDIRDKGRKVEVKKWVSFHKANNKDINA